MQNTKKENKKILQICIKIIIVLGFLFCHLFITKYHEPWRDEAQWWVLAKNMSVGEMYKQLSIEGHPILWFLILKVLIALGLQYKYLSIFTTIIVTIAVALLFFCTEIPLHTSLIAVCSAAFVYRNPIVSRPYAMIVLLVVLLILFWKKRYEKPILYGFLIALLFQTHIIMSGMACGLLLIMGIQCIRVKFKDTKQIFGTAIGFLSLVFLCAELFPRHSGTVQVPVSASQILGNIGSETVLRALKFTSFGVFVSDFSWYIQIFMVLIAIVFCFVIALCIYSLIKRKKELFDIGITAFAGYLAGGMIVGLIYIGTDQMRGTWYLCVTFLFCFTVYNELKKPLQYSLSLVLLIMCFASLIIVLREGYTDFRNPNTDDSCSFSKFVSEEVPENSVILVSEEYSIPAAYAFISEERPDIQIYSIDKKEDYSVHLWQSYEQLSLEEWNEIVNSFDKNRTVYYWNCRVSTTAPEEALNSYPVVYESEFWILDSNIMYLVRSAEE